MVLLDVVYNHFGPDGNYLHGYAPQFFNPRHQTPWGAAINFDGPSTAAPCATSSSTTRCTGSRNTTSTACAWMPCIAIVDDSPPHILTELADARAPGRRADERHVHLVLENDRNQARLPAGATSARRAGATAQWNDDCITPRTCC